MLKGRLTASEQALAEASRREAEARAELGVVGGSLAAAQQAHAKEVDLLRKLAAVSGMKSLTELTTVGLPWRLLVLRWL